MAPLLDALREFVALSLQVSPFLLLGAAAGAALQTFLTERVAGRIFGGKRRRALPAAVAAGALFPGCACATVPIAAGLAARGGPRLGTVAAFIFVSPLLSPITVALTWGMLGWEMTFARAVASVAGAFLLGAVLNRLEGRLGARFAQPLPIAGGSEPSCGPSAGCQAAETVGAVREFWTNLRRIMRAVLPYFLIGIVIAAAITATLPEEAIPTFLGDSAGFWAYLLAALVGIPIYVCEGEEVPITYALVQHGLGPGPSLTFLLGSVGTCIPTVLMSRRVIGPRATAFYLVFWFPFAIGAGVLFQLFIGS